jgi:hypothetical protein
MASIFEEVSITWGKDENGEDKVWTVTPTYRMVQRIEQTVSIAGLSARIARGEPPISHMAEVLYVLLSSAGATVSPEDVYQELMTIDDESALVELAQIVITAFMPQGKSDSQGSGQG